MCVGSAVCLIIQKCGVVWYNSTYPFLYTEKRLCPVCNDHAVTFVGFSLYIYPGQYLAV